MKKILRFVQQDHDSPDPKRSSLFLSWGLQVAEGEEFKRAFGLAFSGRGV
jgi:hypothetical protein